MGERRGGRRAKKSGVRGSCSPIIMYERIIKKKPDVPSLEINR